ncbi:MAG: DUF1573 domain-containing protein [Bacteroidia bacterium]|nr:DUF1573 domain-containing protein [Bacteroidia bacterium]
MKKIVTLATAVLLTALPAISQIPAAQTETTVVAVTPDFQTETVKWSKTANDFGTVPMGPAAEVTFKFTNNGTAPIVIKSANASCGCTTPTYTKTPVMPGESGEVKASYGTEGRPGYFQKTVTVTFDNGVSQVLTIQGTVATETAPANKNELK